MRVIAGKYRHRILTWPDDAKHIRPTKDRIRESIFGALGDVEDYLVLDLYAGSGAMGIEALSRGARKAVFVDNNTVAIKTVNANLKSLQIPSSDALVLFLSDEDALNILKNDGYQFDLVILDPPYKEGKYSDIISILNNNKLLSEKAIIVTECDKELELPFEMFSKIRKYKYGEIRVNIMWR